MNKFRLAFNEWFGRSKTDERGPTSQNDQMSHDIKGSIFTLLALFELISLTSYIPLDSFNLFSGRIDHMNNLGGIVGAIVSEWFLGTVGIMGYSVILLTIYFSFSAFRGRGNPHSKTITTATFLYTVLGAIACYLIFKEKLPEASQLQGGYIGKWVGTFLEKLFNSSGALLIVAGGFILTFLFTTHFSIAKGLRKILGETEEEIAAVPRLKIINPDDVGPIEKVSKQTVKEVPVPVKAKRSRKKKSEAATTTVSSEAEAGIEEEIEPDNKATATEEPAENIYSFIDLKPFKGNYSYPSSRLLKSAPSVKKLSKSEIKDIAEKLCEHLLSFQVTGDITSVTQGPVLTTYEFKPSAGVKLSKIAALQEDLGVVLGTRELRIIAPIPGKTVVGIEVPRPQIETISLKEIFAEKEFQNKKIKIPVALGKATDGVPVFGDLAAMPHLLVAGSTGSGKSVFINSLIMSLIYRMSPSELRLILVDPKMLELNVFDGLPHLVTNVITDNRIAFNAISWAVEEMDRRYKLMASTASKNIDSYNEKVKGGEKLPYIVVIVDELADLMMSGGEMVEVAITRLAQKARAAGIHLILATQRPSTDVVTGLIKANIPSRISFKVPSGIDSRTVLDTGGAEDLIGRGDCLMIQPAVPLRRLHGTFVTEDELKRSVKFAIGGKDHSENYIDFSGRNPKLDDE